MPLSSLQASLLYSVVLLLNTSTLALLVSCPPMCHETDLHMFSEQGSTTDRCKKSLVLGVTLDVPADPLTIEPDFQWTTYLIVLIESHYGDARLF